MLLDAPYECTLEDEAKMRLPENKGSGGTIMDFFPKADYGAYREWYNADADGNYARLSETLDYVAEAFATRGPFDGILGFSQGGNLATMIAVLAERGELEAFKTLGFFVGLSGHRPRDPRVSRYLEDGRTFATRALFVVHTDDPVVPATLTRSLTPLFDNAELVELPGDAHAPASLSKPGSAPAVERFFLEARRRKESKEDTAKATPFLVRSKLGALVRETRYMGSPQIGDLLPVGTRVLVAEQKTIVGNTVRCRLISPVAGWCSRKNLQEEPPKAP